MHGVNKPQTNVIYILSNSSEPSRNMSGPLKVYFSGNTPLVNGFSITVQVFTSKPATAICRLGQTKTMPCELLLSQHQCIKCFRDFIPAVCIYMQFQEAFLLLYISCGSNESESLTIYCTVHICTYTWTNYPSNAPNTLILTLIVTILLGPPGSTTTFQNVLSGYYNLRVTATTADGEEAEVSWKMYIPIASTTCSVNLINAGLVVNGTQATAEFQAVGAATGFKCKVDNRRFDPCKNPCM